MLENSRNLIRILLLSLSLFAVSCTKASAPKDTKMPMLMIEKVDRTCTQDSDCVLMRTQCSCSCGQGVNRANTNKYDGKLDELCKTYRGILCKMACNGHVTCLDNMCTYVPQ